MTIAEQLNIEEFPFIIKDKNGNETYYENSNKYWVRKEYDSNGNETYYEDSNKYWVRKEYDSNGNETYYENSRGNKRGTPKVNQTNLSLEESRLAKLPFDIKKLRKGDIVRFLGWNNTSDRSWKGDIMQVISIDYPMVILKNKTNMHSFCNSMHSFDSREAILDYPTEEYIKLKTKK